MTQNERISIPWWWKGLLFLFSLVLFSAQVVLLYYSIDLYIRNTYIGLGWLYLLFEGIGLFTVLFVIRKSMPTNYKLIWSVLILLLPLPFTTLYVLNQISKHLSAKSCRKHQVEITSSDMDYTEELKEKDITAYNMVKTIQNAEKAPLYKNIGYTYFGDMKEKLTDMISEIRKAEHFIYMEYFVISPGKLMDSLYPVLLEKGTSGTEIKIIYDDLGSKGALNQKLIKKLTQIPNCEVAAYQPVGLNFNLLVNYRDHRKLTIIDGKVCYCGGDNLADEYINEKERFGVWRDACGKYTGNASKAFTRMFLSTWYRVTLKKQPASFLLPECETEGEGYVLPFSDGPTNASNPAYDLFCSLISNAQRYVYISTPYFVIDDAMIDLLSRKIRSGVEVKLLMPHIPDKKTAFYMGRLNYRDLYKAGGRVYEYTPGFNHAKTIIVDDKYAFIGTVNMDYRSLFLHYECGALIIGNPEILKMKEDYLSAISQSMEFDYNTWHKKKWYQRLIGYIFALFAPLF